MSARRRAARALRQHRRRPADRPGRSGRCTRPGFDVTVLCGPNGRAAAELLPGVADVWEFRAPWIDPDSHPVDRAAIDTLLTRVAAGRLRAGDHLHQLPPVGAADGAAAADGRRADDRRQQRGLPRHAARRPPSPARRSCTRSTATWRWLATLGHRLPADDDGALRIAVDRPTVAVPFAAPYVVVHPGASVPARAWSPDANRAAVDDLVDAGWRVAVTGGSGERALTAHVAGPSRDRVVDLGGATDLAGLATVIDWRGGHRRRQHRRRPRRRGGRHAGRVHLRADRPGGALAPVAGAARPARRSGHRVPPLPGPHLPGAGPSLRGVGRCPPPSSPRSRRSPAAPRGDEAGAA